MHLNETKQKDFNIDIDSKSLRAFLGIKIKSSVPLNVVNEKYSDLSSSPVNDRIGGQASFAYRGQGILLGVNNQPPNTY